ncbi:MAG: alpha-L-fucosidase [Anaerohalosphaera sp.]|nr:alpha-L-fucosidase [Anaerohalosphaera sp.]
MLKRHSCMAIVFSIMFSMLLIAGCGTEAVADAKPVNYLNESQADKDARMDWWRQARFGMFIHWGAYAVLEGYYNDKPTPSLAEWIMSASKVPVDEYEKVVARFNPVSFNADEWVRVAKQAGMKYIVITSKHHDGFCIWDSAVTDYDIIDRTPFKRDILKELSVACKKQGVKLCFYHSIMDWHHPDAKGDNWPKYRDEYMKPQLKELVEKYDPAVMWFDGEWIKDWTEPQGKELYNYVRSLKPDIIVNNRVGKGRQGMKGLTKEGYSGDFGTPEQEIPSTGLPGVDWESCMTLFHHWGYHKDYQKWLKPSETYIRQLVDIASKGGNLLLNIGPMADGLFPQPCVQRFSDMGSWMAINGESIYGTTASPFKRLEWGRCTQKNGKLYLHVFDWPKDGKLVVPGLKNKITKAYLLAGMKGHSLSVKRQGDDVVVVVPGKMDSASTVIVIDIVGKPDITPEGIKQAADGSISLPAEDALLKGNTIRVEEKGNKPNIGYWTNVADSVEWEFKVADGGLFTVMIDLSCDDSSAGSEYVVVVGNEKLAATVKGTGAWEKLKKVNVGKIKIADKGMNKITIKAKSKPGLAVMNLQSVKLVPVK